MLVILSSPKRYIALTGVGHFWHFAPANEHHCTAGEPGSVRHLIVRARQRSVQQLRRSPPVGAMPHHLPLLNVGHSDPSREREDLMFENLTFRRGRTAICAGKPGSEGITVKGCKIRDVVYGINTGSENSRAWCIADTISEFRPDRTPFGRCTRLHGTITIFVIPIGCWPLFYQVLQSRNLEFASNCPEWHRSGHR